MREIKFRAWDYKNNRWTSERDAMESIGLKFGVRDYFINIAGERAIRWSFCQYTGLKDKNGNEIYEGDICRLFSCDRPIVFKDGSFGYMTDFNDLAWFVAIGNNSHFNWKDGYSDKIEIIGNIYENPELLNREQNDNRSVATTDPS